jgi:hypothetical protein
MQLEPLAELVSRQAADLEVYAGFLFATLDGALPPDVLEVQRRSSLTGRLRGKQADVVAVTVRLGEHAYALRRAGVGSPVQATVAHEVGGIVLATRQLPLADWSDQLVGALHRLAGENAAAATALQRMTTFTV